MFIRNAHIAWDEISPDSYLRSIPAVSKIVDLELRSNITFFVGENGTGKSTILEAIADAYGFNPEGGTINFRFSSYEDISELGSHMRLYRGPRAHFGYFFRAECFFNLATQAEEYNLHFGGKYLHQQSHGEGFWSFFHKYSGAGLYIMDEPEAALSPQRQLSLLIHISQMAEMGSQFIIISHSPILLGIPNADIISFDGGEVHRITYEETDSYQITEMFINNRERLLHQLLRDFFWYIRLSPAFRICSWMACQSKYTYPSSSVSGRMGIGNCFNCIACGISRVAFETCGSEEWKEE